MIRKIKQLMFMMVIGMGVLTGCADKGEEVPIVPELEQTQEVEDPEETTQVPSTGSNKSMIQIAMQNPITLNPIYNMDKSVQQNLYLIFDTLVNIEEDGSITPNLAETWAYSEVENALTIKLRDDVKWHDAQPFTADDVMFTLKTIQTAPESSYKQSTKNIANMQVMPNNTLKIYYRQPFSGVLQSLFFPVIPQHIYDVEYDKQVALAPVGTGPYKYEKTVPYKEITFIRNDDYFMGQPSIERINVMIAPDEQSMLYSFEQELIDVIYTDVMDWGKYAKDKSAEIHEVTTNCYEFLGVNFSKVIFQNKQIREALVYGLDRQELLDIYYLGHGVVTDTPISPYSYLFDQTLESRAYDKEKAKLILAQEGYVLDPTTKIFTKNNIPLSFSIMINEGNQQRVRVAEGIQKMYKEIGIQVDIERVESSIYMQRLYSKQFDAFLGGWKLSYVPDLTFAFHSSQSVSGDNFISYNNPKMDQLLTSTFSTSPMDIQESYAELQQFIAEENPYISLYFRNGALITKKKITGTIKPNPLNVYANIEEWQLVQ